MARTKVAGAFVVSFLAAVSLRAQWSATGGGIQVDRGLRFTSGDTSAVVSVVTPEVIRVRMARGNPRDHSYAVVMPKTDALAEYTVAGESAGIETAALRVRISKSPFRVEFVDKLGQVLDQDRGTTFSDSGFRVSKRLRDDEHVYALGEKTGPLDKRGWKLGGYSYTMWNSDTFGYDSSTDPIYVSVPFYIVLRKGVAFGVFLDNTYRSNFDIGHQTPGVLSFGADGGALDYYFIYGPEPKKVIERYTALTGRMPLPPVWSIGYNQCRYSYYPESRVRFIATNFRERKIPADVLWLDIHYQQGYKPFTWDAKRFPDPAGMISDLRKDGFRVVTIVDPHPAAEKGYAPYDTGVAGDYLVKNPDGSIYKAPVWPSRPEETVDWSKPSGTPSVFPDFSKPSARAWWGSLYSGLVNAGVAGIWNDMNEPAVFDTPTGTMPLDVRHDNEGSPTDHREIHNVYGMLMSRSTYEGLLKLRPNERPFILSRASFAGGQRYAALWPGDNVSTWTHMRQSIPTLLGLGLSGFPFVGSDIGGFAGVPTAELYTRWLQLGVFYPFMRTHTVFGSPDQEPWSYGTAHEAINRRAIELRYQLLPHLYSAMRDASVTGIPAMRPLMLEYPEDERTYGIDDEFLFGSDLLVAPVLDAEATTRSLFLPNGQWYDYWTGARYDGGKGIDVPVTLSSIPMFVKAGAFVFQQDVVQHTGEMPGNTLDVVLFPAATPSSRSLYEDDGTTFAYQRGAYMQRQFTARRDGTATIVEVSAPQGTYRPAARDMRITVRDGATTKVVKVRDTFAPMQIRVE